MLVPKIPTDLEILNTIYELYHKDFVPYDQDEKIEGDGTYVPVDCQEIADRLNVNKGIVFGCLSYHLEQKYGYDRIYTSGLARSGISEKRSRTRFFWHSVSVDDGDYINFPLLVSALADLRQEKDKFETMILATALVAIVPLISIFAN